MLPVMLLVALNVGAPVPVIPSIEGKYILVSSQSPSTSTRGPGTGATAPGGFGTAGPSGARRETLITKDSIAIDGRTGSWEYKLDASKKPMEIEITITPTRGKKTKHAGIVEIAGERMTIAYAADGAARPKDTEDAEGVSIFVFQKAPPPPRTEYRLVVSKTGDEAEVEKKLNQLAKEGFEVSSATPLTGTPSTLPSIHYLLKRSVPGDSR